MIVFFSFLIVYIPISIKISNKKNKRIKEKNSFENFKLQLQFSKETNLIKFLENYLNINSIVKIETSHYFINNSFDLFICLSKNCDFNNINYLFTNRLSEKIIILSQEKFDIPIDIENVNFEIIDSLSLYNYSLLYKENFLDNINIKKRPKYSLKDIVCIVLNKEKSKSYFGLGILLLFSSLFTPFSTYYIIFSTILFILALLSRLNFIKKENSQ